MKPGIGEEGTPDPGLHNSFFPAPLALAGLVHLGQQLEPGEKQPNVNGSRGC